MSTQEQEQGVAEVTYRVATCPRYGFVPWTLHRPTFPNRYQAEGYAQAAVQAGASNAIILKVRGGEVEVPSWLHVREEEP